MIWTVTLQPSDELHSNKFLVDTTQALTHTKLWTDAQIHSTGSKKKTPVVC